MMSIASVLQIYKNIFNRNRKQMEIMPNGVSEVIKIIFVLKANNIVDFHDSYDFKPTRLN